MLAVKKALAALLMASVLGCSRTPTPPHNSRYYIAHPKARAEMLQRCSEDQNRENLLDCIAAQDAKRSADLEQSLGRR